MSEENCPELQQRRHAVLIDLQSIIDSEETTVPDRLKAIGMKAQFLGVGPSTSSGGPDSSIPFDVSFNEVMQDPILRKRAAKLEADTQKAIDRGRQ